MSTADARLEVKKLTKRFGGLVAVKDISFRVKAGEILGLIGPNGSGKSTAMKAIMGIERPDGGSVRIDGTEVAGRAVIATGERATDLAVRLDHAGVTYTKDTRPPLLAASSATADPVVIAATYTNFLAVSRELARNA